MLRGQFVSVNEAAALIGCTTGHVCLLLQHGKIEGTKLNARAWAVNSDSLAKFLKKPKGVGRPRLNAK